MKGLQKAFEQPHGGNTEFWRVTEMLMLADGSGYFTRSGWVAEANYDAVDLAEVKANQTFVLADVTALKAQVIEYAFKRLALITEFVGGTFSGGSASTLVLLHFNGSDAATTFTDSSLNAWTVSAVGNAQLDTAQKYFGTASLLLDGAGDAVSIPHDTDFDVGTGDFTIDMMVRFAAMPTGANVFYLFDLNTTSISISTDGIDYFMDVQLAGGTVYHYGITASINTWYYVGVTRVAGTVYLVFNDVLLATVSDSGSISGGTSLIIGDSAISGGPMNGWIDEFRFSNISIGVATPTAEYVVGYTSLTSTQAQDTGRNATHWIISKVAFDATSNVAYAERKGYIDQTEYNAGSAPLVIAKEEFSADADATILDSAVQAGLVFLKTLASPDFTDATEIP